MLLALQTQSQDRFTYPNLTNESKTIYADGKTGIRIRTMSLNELIYTRNNWLIPEGWAGIKHTLGATFANDRDGFYLLELNSKKIACISVVTYPSIHFAYIGFYVVIKEYRGQGYGKILITKTMEYATKNLGITCFGLNCVEAAVPMYQQYGFQTATIDEFWKYTAQSNKSMAAEHIETIDKMNDALFQNILDFDLAILGTSRQDFLLNFLFKPNTTTIIAKDGNQITGYGVMSARDPAIPETFPSYKLSPLYANDAVIAKQLLQQLLAITKPNECTYIETPGNNPIAAELMKSVGCEKIGIQHKMFTSTLPNFATQHMYCYNSIAIGG